MPTWAIILLCVLGALTVVSLVVLGIVASFLLNVIGIFRGFMGGFFGEPPLDPMPPSRRHKFRRRAD